MKKRILALALAGTTAFSVFGAAMSANAAHNTVESTVTLENGKIVYRYTDDAYLPYKNVAKTVTTNGYKADQKWEKYYDVDTGKNVIVADNNADDANYGEIADYNKTIAKQDDYTPEIFKITNDQNQSMFYDADGNVYTVEVNVNNNSVATLVTDSTMFETEINKATIQLTTPQESTTDKYCIGNITFATLTAAIEYIRANDDPQNPSFTFGAGGHYLTNNEVKYIKAGVAQYTGLDAISNDTYNDLPADDATYAETNIKILESTDMTGTGNAATVVVGYDSNGDHKVDANSQTASSTVKDNSGTEYSVAYQTKWVFSSSDTSTTVSPYTLNSVVETNPSDPDYGCIITTAVNNNTVYAYDFIPAAVVGNTSLSAMSTVASKWNYGTVTATTAAIGNVGWTAETGSGTRGVGVRYDVVNDWIDFLDELGINHDGEHHYVEDFDQFKENYWDLFYLDPVYNKDTGLQSNVQYVDLYNIRELLHNIYDYSYKTAWSQANTSELVYLMQQYDKYIGDYISPAEVTNDNWGDLLLSILESATEADFKSTKEYKKYTNKVSGLRDAYEEAATATQVYNAEYEMYQTLINSDDYGTAKGDYADARAELKDAINGLYFNATTKASNGTVIPTYTLELAKHDTTYAQYKNYEYLVAAAKTNYGYTTTSVNFSVNKAAGYYTLYPMADYIDYDATTPNEVYAGNAKDTAYAGKLATEEYEWFWNVYQLAAKMYNGYSNVYSGSLTAVMEALGDAADDLTTVTTASQTATAAVDELQETYEKKMQGFVPGEINKDDFDKGYYSKYEEAVAYADKFTGKYQAQVAANIMEVAGKALTYQGTQTEVTKNDMKTVETAIAAGEKALKALTGEAYNAAQVNALNKAVSQAKNLLALYRGEYATYADAQSVDHTYSKVVRDKDQMLKSDVTEAIEAINSAIDYSEIVMGWSKNDAGKWMYGTEDGYLNNGWNKIGSVWYYFNEDGTAKQSEWMQEDGKWYWFNSNAGAAIGWAKVDGQWYYFGGNNAMKTGWQKVDGSWYYLASSGRMITGWAQVDGKWYYMSKESNSLGQMLANTTTPDGYKVGADGAMLTK